MVLARNELLVLKNFTIRMEFVHSLTLARRVEAPRFNQEGAITNQEEIDKGPQMTFTINYFTPAGLASFNLHADTEIELLVAYGDVLKQMGVDDSEINGVLKALTDEMHPDGIGRAVNPVTELVEHTAQSTDQPASTSPAPETPKAQ